MCPPRNSTIALDAQLRVQADHLHSSVSCGPAFNSHRVLCSYKRDLAPSLQTAQTGVYELSPSLLHTPLFLGSDKNVAIDDFYHLFQKKVLKVASLQTDSKQRSLLSSLIPDHLGRLFNFDRSWIKISLSKLC